MNISTKFNLRRDVFLIIKGRIEKGIVDRISIEASDKLKVDIKYTLISGTGSINNETFPEDRLFKSKEALIKDLESQ